MRLCDIQIDENKWSITKTIEGKCETYHLYSKERDKEYLFHNVIGLEQLNENEFLVYSNLGNKDYTISRYLVDEKDELITKYYQRFDKFDFINDDRILFMYCDNSARYRSLGIYSIKDNEEVSDGKWLNGKIVETYVKENTNEIKLYVEIGIYSYVVGDNKLIFTLNPDTLEPNSECYSTLRDSFLQVNTISDIENIEKDDKKSIDEISHYMFEEKQEIEKKAKQRILKNT